MARFRSAVGRSAVWSRMVFMVLAEAVPLRTLAATL